MASKKPKDEPKKEEKTEPLEEEKVSPEEKEPFKVDILLCLLCEKQIHTPKSLTCLHSFCEPCLTNYVDGIIEDSKVKGKIEISCPECKLLVFQTLGRLNAKSYSENLPTGTICSTLLCEPSIVQKSCHFNDGCQREAVNWCGYCAKALCKEHTELHKQLTTMKIYHPTIQLSEAQNLVYPYQKCVHHPKEDMAFFCPRDWSTTCNICGKVQHRTCYFLNRGVLPIPEIASEIKGSHTTRELEPKLDALEGEAQELSKDRQHQLDRLEAQLQTGKDNIYAFRKVMDEYLDQLESELNGELDSKYEYAKTELEQEKLVIDTRLRTVKHYKIMLDAIQSKSTNVQAVTELSKLREQTEAVNNDIQQRKQNLKRTSLSVQPITNLNRILPRMGSVNVKEFGRQLGQWKLRKSKTTLLN